MNKTSLTEIFRKKLIQWILLPGLVLTALVVFLIALSQLRIVEREIIQLSRSLSQNVGYYMDGAKDVMQTFALLKHKDDEQELQKTFEGLRRSFSRFERLILLDSNENIVAVAPRGISGVDFPIRLSDSKGQRHTLTSPIISPHSGKLVVFTSVPTDNGGKIVAELNLNALQQFIYGFVSSERTIILTDAFGNLIVHPNQQLVQIQYNIGSLDLFDHPTNQETAQFYTADGTLYYGTVRKIPDTGWKLIVASRAQTIFQPVLVLGMLIALLTSGIFMMLLVALNKEFRVSVTEPLQRYIARLTAVAKGDYPATTTQDDHYAELAKFGQVFEQMAAQVRKREEELRISKTFFQSVIDSMPSALVWVDNDLMVRQCNTKAKEVFGSKADLQNGPKNVDDFFQGQQDITSVIHNAEWQNSPKKLERHRINSTHTTIYDVTIYPLLAPDMNGVIVRMDDITSQVRMEEIMVQTEKMMSVGGLAAGMAHEINNPLGSILQGAQNLRRRFSPEIAANLKAAETAGCSLESMQAYMEERKILRIIDGIAQSGKRAAHIVANMLEFSKPGNAEKTIVNVTELVESALDLATHDYDLKKKYDFLRINVIRELADNLPSISCSRTEIEQVLFNILKNAAQAMTEEESNKAPTITIRTRSDKGGVAIEIEDNGPGMPPDVRRRIFEPFFTTKPTGIGTGLGLSVSYFIITQNHGGSLTVDSSPSEWTRFTIVLPTK